MLDFPERGSGPLLTLFGLILHNDSSCRNPMWTESVAVEDENFILSTKEKLGGKAVCRKSIKKKLLNS